MRALSDVEIDLAKTRAARYLAKSIVSLCITLGLDADTVTSSTVSLPEEDNYLYYAHISLIAQLSALEKIS
jgi:hypothetical protein